jgi:hypothetical protein
MSMFELIGGAGEKKEQEDPRRLAQAAQETPPQVKSKEEEVIKTLASVNLDQFNAHMRLSVPAFNRLRGAFLTRSS